MSRYSKRVMVFGVFDCLHAGHRSFLGQAKRYGDELIAVVARDAAVFQLKKRKPLQSERSRIRAVRNSKAVTRATLGDPTLGSYNIIRRWKPDIICLGYDQKSLEQDLKKQIREGMLAPIRLIRLRPYKPHRLHTSILQKKWYAKK